MPFYWRTNRSSLLQGALPLELGIIRVWEESRRVVHTRGNAPP